jgi:FkbM family methyltransferase
MITPAEIKAFVACEDPVILDIGCNDGTHTRMFLDLFERAQVFSFEPDARARARFMANAHPRAQLIASAVGAIDGVIDFYPSEGMPAPLPEVEAAEVASRLGKGGWDYSGSIRAPKLHLVHHPWCKFGAKVQVPIMRLDTWAQGRSIDFIWADVQGAEIDLIMGGLETLAHTRYFYTEYSNSELYEGQVNLEHIMDLLPNFEIVTRWAEDVLLRNTCQPE